MGWPPDKYRAALSNALNEVRRASSYSEAQVKLMEVNSIQDREELRSLIERLEQLILRSYL